jgi:hypothetical protein
VSYLYSLYDALVSIAVPPDKARAVVDAMEHDMATTLATKSDLENLRLATKSDLENLRLATKSEFEKLTLVTEQKLELLRKDMETGHRELADKIDDLGRSVSKDIAAVELKMTVKLGTIIAVSLTAAVAALRLWA